MRSSFHETAGAKPKYNSFSVSLDAGLPGGFMTVLSLARRLAVCLALAMAFNLSTPMSHAVSAKSLEKQARKIEAKLAKFPKGALIHLYFRGGGDSTGKLRKLSDNSFSFTSSDSNTDESYNYSDVTRVEKGKEYIGKDSESHHRFHLPF
jgi:hypothetical protein